MSPDSSVTVSPVPGPPTRAQHQLGGVLGPRELHQRGGDAVADHRVVAAAEVLDQAPLAGERGVRDAGREAVAAGHVHGEQIAAGRPGGDAGGPSYERVALRAAGQRDDDPFPGLPHPPDAVPRPVVLECLVDAVGDPEQRELAQGGEIAGAEVVGEGGVDLLRRVHVAVGHPPPQPLRGHVHQLDLVGPAYDVVGHRLVLRHVGDPLDDVVEGLQVLDVERGDHVDPGAEQHLDVLPPLGIASPAGHVRVRELVDDRHLGPPREHGGEVHLLELPAPVRASGTWHDLKARQHRLGAWPAVALGEPHHHVRAPRGTPPALVEHPVGLADARGRPEVDLQPSGPYISHRRRRAPLTGSTPGGSLSAGPVPAGGGSLLLRKPLGPPAGARVSGSLARGGGTLTRS
jgi:hypothetical protein